MRGYYFVNQNLTWSEAQQFCRQHYHDLACVSSSEHNLRLPRPPGYSAPVWIGLYDDPTNLREWKWSTPNSSVHFWNWRSGEPQYVHEEQQCAILTSSGWQTSNRCASSRLGLCYSDSNPKAFHLTNLEMTWLEALDYCRANYKDLAMIESNEENDAAWAVADSSRVWIGLRRFTGQWSDNRAVTFTAWYNLEEPVLYTEPFCAAENELNSWEVFSCEERRPFYCQELTKGRVVKIKFSGHNLNISVINQLISEEIQKRFEAAGRTDVKITWKTSSMKQPKKEVEPEDCPAD